MAALVSAGNKLAEGENFQEGREERVVDIIKYINGHYAEVTLENLSENFNLSRPYISKYIKDKTGMNFQDVVREARMRKARTLLKESGHSVESIAADVGYESVEHFNRLFKKSYGITPVQFRVQK